MATQTMKELEQDTTRESPSRQKFLTLLKERFGAFLTELSGPPRTHRKRLDDQLFADRLDRWYPRA